MVEVELDFEEDVDVACPLCGGHTSEQFAAARAAFEAQPTDKPRKQLDEFLPVCFWKDPLHSYSERKCPCCDGKGTISVLACGTTSGDVEFERDGSWYD